MFSRPGLGSRYRQQVFQNDLLAQTPPPPRPKSAGGARLTVPATPERHLPARYNICPMMQLRIDSRRVRCDTTISCGDNPA